MRVGAAVSLCLALFIALGWEGPAAAQPQIVWRVENPFRFFLDPADTEVHRATWQSLSETERRHPVQSAERALSERHPDGWSSFTFAKTCWDWTRNRYVCREGLEDAQTVDCSWLTAPQGAGRGPRSKVVTLPCDTPVQLDVPYPAGAWISAEIGGSQVAETA